MAAERRIDFTADRARYRQLADILRDAITAGEYRPGDPLPAEQTLAQTYEIGVDTVRDGLAILRAEGLIETEHGRRSRVRAAMKRAALTMAPGARAMARMPTEAERRRLGLSEGVPILVVTSPRGHVSLYPADRYELRGE
jgi:GntR family transcriptional regulator